MALDRYAKLELAVRTAFREHLHQKLSNAKQKIVIFPGFEIPRGGSIDLIIKPKGGTILCMVQRSDYVAAYKHTVGQMFGIIAHCHNMQAREVREALRTCQNHPDMMDLKQGKVDILKISKRFVEDIKKGALTIALVTELPEVPQQAKELELNFFPIGAILQDMLTLSVKKKKLCEAVEFHAVNTNADPPKVALLKDSIKPLLKLTS